MLILTFGFMVMKTTIKYINLIALFFLVFACTQPVTQEEIPEKEEIFICDAEEIDREKWKFTEAQNKDFYFENIDRQSNQFAVSGNYSVKLFPGAPYGMTTYLTGVNPDDYLVITAWRKSNNQNGIIVADGGPGFYQPSKLVVEKGKNNWEKVFLEYHVPPNFTSGKFKIYVWNNSRDTVYFDDLQIILRETKKYPGFSDVPGLQLFVDPVQIDTLAKKRFEAFEKTVLVNSDEDYTNAILFNGTDFINAGFRLKGDLVDPLQGEKWSFRLKLKNDFTWQHMRTFSVQNPETRYFLREWLAHKIFEQADVLTTRYGFVPLSLNDKQLGIYAWEEHFEKQLIENKNRREGPIVRFDESVFWQTVLETKVTGQPLNVDFFGAAKITPFKEGSTLADSLLSKQFNEAQKLLLQYKNRKKPVSEIFDVDKLARYYALLDITQAYHGFTWHNQRFYYNPITCLLEPIAFDGYIETGIYKRFDEPVTGLLNPEKLTGVNREELMLFQVFADPVFCSKYVEYLEKYSSPRFIEKIISTYGAETDSLAKLIKREFTYYNFKFDPLINQAEFIQANINLIADNCIKLGEKYINTGGNIVQEEFKGSLNKNLIPMLVNAYFSKTTKLLTVMNFSNHEIRITGVTLENKSPQNFAEMQVLPRYSGLEPEQVSIKVEGNPGTVFFRIDDEKFETKISPWQAPEGISARQKTMDETDFSNLPVFGNQVVFDGHYQFSSDLVIPAAKEVIFKAGTSIDLINGAGFFSFSPLKMEGSKTAPIEIFSSDKSANGFNVLQPTAKSTLNHVRFKGLSNLRKDGWVTPSAVTFYEADVDFDNCIFADNSNCDDALNVVRSSFSALNCTFENTFADAFDSDFCTGVVQNCTFKNTGNDAIDFSGSQVKIIGCTMTEIADKAISGGENSQLTVSNCNIEKANIGVAAKDLSVLKLDKISMENTVYGLVAFVKKPEYGPASIIINNLKMNKNIIFHKVEEGSVLTLNGKTIYGKEKKLAIKLYQ